ncbi:putative membrane protein [Rhizobium aquaticum]|uniref:Membrane protein n=1 Tax=Rhizobium aquaticum TaxID=1549636 RepID=A0ABV2IX63_9HYPH
MSELIVIGYNTQEQAETAREALYKLAKEYLIEVEDAVVATAEQDGQIKLHQMVNLWAMGASGGAFWGLLAGLVFLNPLVGVAAGAGAGALAGALSDYGINDGFMKDVSAILQPGQAALFVSAKRATSDRVVEEMSKHGGRILRTNLDRTQEQALRDAFANARQEVLSKDAPVAATEKAGDQPA